MSTDMTDKLERMADLSIGDIAEIKGKIYMVTGLILRNGRIEVKGVTPSIKYNINALKEANEKANFNQVSNILGKIIITL